MNRNPEELADADIDQIIFALRAQRKTWAENEAKPKARKARKAEGNKNLTLDDLL